MADETLELQLWNTQAEMIVLGTCYKNIQGSFFSCINVLQNSDFHDKAMAFYHQFLTDYVLQFSNEITEAKANTFASMNAGRLAGYKKFGYYRTISEIMKLATSTNEELRNQIDTLKKYSLLRELHKSGHDVSKILTHRNFNSFTADMCANLVRGNIDKICAQTISGIDEPIDLSEGAVDIMDSFLEAPEHGIDTAWDFLNERCSGLMPGDSLGLLALSNSGKGRSLIYLASHLALVEGATTAVFANEMLPESMRLAYHVTVCNSPKIQKLHGNEIHIPERRYKYGAYLDTDGNIIYRYIDDEGNYTETVEDFKERLLKTSEEYRSVKSALKWLEENGKNKLLFKNVAADYSDENLQRLVRQAVMVKGAQVWCYDTLKHGSGSDMSSWSDLVKTTTVLTELNQTLQTSSAIMTCQLSDAAHDIRIENANSSYIASARHIYHLFDQMVVMLHCKEDWKSDYELREYDNGWGGMDNKPLDDDAHYVFCNLIKNRRGEKGLFALKADLNTNVWETESGILIPKGRGV